MPCVREEESELPMNPFDAILRHIQNGMSPQAVLGQLSRNDPRAAQALQMLQGKNADQLRQMAENMARERGTTVEQIAQSLGLKMPK